MYRKIIAVFMAVMVVATTCAVPSFATDYQSTYNFWNWAYDNSWFLGKLITGSADNVCSVSEDTLHHSTNHQKGDTVDGEQQYTCICDDCGQTFSAVATDLANSYDDGSDGYQSIDSSGRVSGFGRWEVVDVYRYTATYGLAIVDANNIRVHVENLETTVTGNHSFHLAYYFKFPHDATIVFDGAFTFVAPELGYSEVTDAFGKFTKNGYASSAGSGNYVDNKRSFNATADIEYYYKSKTVTAAKGLSGDADFIVPNVYVQLDDPLSKFQRIPVNIGGSVQYTDDNSNNKIYDAEFMDFSTNEYHNPVTDYSTKVDNWNYDYSTRTFTGCTEDGDVKIVYGDEYMSVTENGNIYNYYYSSGSGSGSGGDSSGDDDDKGLFGKIGELLGTLLGGLIDLVTGVLSGILDSLISLVEMTIEKLGSVVNLFGSFGDALRALWSWLPEDIITILSAGVSVVIFAAVLKLFI